METTRPGEYKEVLGSERGAVLLPRSQKREKALDIGKNICYHICSNLKGEIKMPIKRNDGMNAVQRYQAKCDCITIRPLADVGAKIRASASEANMNVTQYILTAIDFYEKHKER